MILALIAIAINYRGDNCYGFCEDAARQRRKGDLIIEIVRGER